MLTVKIKENTKQGKAFAEFIKTLPFVIVIDDKTNEPNQTTHKALKEAETGKTKKFKDISSLMKDLNS